MKKKIGLLLCALLVSAGALTGCFGSNDEIDTSKPPVMTENVTVSTISLPGEVIEEEKDPVEMINRTVNHGNVVVNYPQVLGLTDTTIEDAVNALIKSDVNTFSKKYLVGADYESGEMTDTVIQHENTISIVSSGIMVHPAEEVSDVNSDDDDDDAETAIPTKEKTTLVYTSNFSILTGKRISTGVREHAATMAEMILNGSATVLETDGKRKADVQAYFEDLGADKLTALLQQCDFTDDGSYPKCFSYYMDADTDDIGIYIPVSKSLGSYAIVLVDTERLI